MTRQLCTDLFQHYRDLARHIWNLGFWPNPQLREPDSVELFSDITARLFEGVVLYSLGYGGRIKDNHSPGEIAKFMVEPRHVQLRLLVDQNLPGSAEHRWGEPTIHLPSSSSVSDSCACDLRFLRFFDWVQMGPLEFQYLEVRIERSHEYPALVGRHALIEFTESAIWFVDE